MIKRDDVGVLTENVREPFIYPSGYMFLIYTQHSNCILVVFLKLLITWTTAFLQKPMWKMVNLISVKVEISVYVAFFPICAVVFVVSFRGTFLETHTTTPPYTHTFISTQTFIIEKWVDGWMTTMPNCQRDSPLSASLLLSFTSFQNQQAISVHWAQVT